MKSKAIKLLALSCAFSTAGWSSASACSIDPSTTQNYYSIVSNDYTNWEKSELSVGLVYVRGTKRKDRDVPQNYYDKKQMKKPFVKMEYELIENISGDFIIDKYHWMPLMEDPDIDRELKLKNTGRNFAFWDRRDLGAPVVYGYAGASTCGPSPTPTRLPGQYYLQFKKGGKTIGMEIISGPKDSFVEDWRMIFSDATTSKIKRKPEFYFREMAGYQDIELETCPTKEELTPLFSSWGKTDDFDLGPLSALNIFRQYEFHKSQITNLKIADLYTYQNRLNEHKWECEAGARYLVLDKRSQTIHRGYRSFGVDRTPQHRYIEINNGSIDTQDILSHITILPSSDGSTEISVAQVKNWIRDANPN